MLKKGVLRRGLLLPGGAEGQARIRTADVRGAQEADVRRAIRLTRRWGRELEVI